MIWRFFFLLCQVDDTTNVVWFGSFFAFLYSQGKQSRNWHSNIWNAVSLADCASAINILFAVFSSYFKAFPFNHCFHKRLLSLCIFRELPHYKKHNVYRCFFFLSSRSAFVATFKHIFATLILFFATTTIIMINLIKKNS